MNILQFRRNPKVTIEVLGAIKASFIENATGKHSSFADIGRPLLKVRWPDEHGSFFAETTTSLDAAMEMARAVARETGLGIEFLGGKNADCHK